MKSLTETFIQQISEMQGCLHALRQKHLYTPSYTEQETLKSALLWMAVKGLERDLDSGFSTILPHLQSLEKESQSLPKEVTSEDWTDDAFTSEVNILP